MNLKSLLIFFALTFGTFAYRPGTFLFIKSHNLNFSDFAYENYIHRNWSLSINNYRRNAQSLSLYISIKAPVNKMQMIANLFKLENDAYRQLLSTPLVELCKILKFSTENFLFRGMMDLVEKTVPGLVHECPYEGVRCNSLNLSFKINSKFKTLNDFIFKFLVSVLNFKILT